MSVYTCPRCHASIVAGQPFCKQCGLPLDAKSIAAFQAQRPAAVPVVSLPRKSRRGLKIGAGALGGLLLVSALYSTTPAAQQQRAARAVTATAETIQRASVPTVNALAAAPVKPPTVVIQQRPSTSPTLVPPTAEAHVPVFVPEQVTTPLATVTVAPSIPPASAAPTTPAFHSGGLGLSLMGWEIAHGAPDTVHGSQRYENKKYTVYFWRPIPAAFPDTAPAQDILVQVDRPLPLTAAHTTAQQFLPADAHLVRTDTFSEGSYTVEVYESVSLIPLFGPKNYTTRAGLPPSTIGPDSYPWGINVPGTFVIVYSGVPVTAINIMMGTAVPYGNIKLTPVVAQLLMPAPPQPTQRPATATVRPILPTATTRPVVAPTAVVMVATPVPARHGRADTPIDCTGVLVPAASGQTCTSFPTWREAQCYYQSKGWIGGTASRLDADQDGVACENRPGAPPR